MQIANDEKVDMVLNGGDLFHENKPTQRSVHKTIEILRKYCLSDKRVLLESVLSSMTSFQRNFDNAVYEDEAADALVGVPSFGKRVGVLSKASGCDLRGAVMVVEDATLVRKNSVVHDCREFAVLVAGTANIQDSILQDCPTNSGIQVDPTGEVTIAGTTVRRCDTGLVVTGKATARAGCRITGNAEGGTVASKYDGGPGEVTVEAGAVCEGNGDKDFVSLLGGTLIDVANEDIVHY